MQQSYDYVIIGTGAAGSVLAHSLPVTSTILSVDIAKYGAVNSFGRKTVPFIDECPDHYTPAFSGVLGGNTALWSGKVYLLTPDELSDWPIRFGELEHFSSKLAEKFGIPHSWVCNTSSYKEGSFFHTSYRSNWGNLYEYLNLEQFPNISILEEHSIVGLTSLQGNISSVQLASRQGERKTVSINRGLILAAGGLGNTHLLLNLLNPGGRDDTQRKAYGNLCDHPHFNIGHVKNIHPFANILKGYLVIRDSERDNIENCLVVPSGRGMVGVQIDGPGAITRLFKRAFYRTDRAIIKISILSVEKLVTRLAYVFKRFTEYRTFGVPYSLELFFSQPSDDFNEVVLSKSHDEFGLNKINIRHRLNSSRFVEHQSQLRDLLGENVRNLNLSKLSEKNVYTGLHPSCTTPMSGTGEWGTLDTDLRVNGFENFYCVGSNVFPTNGITNPTWTIMVLAHRLATFLENREVEV